MPAPVELLPRDIPEAHVQLSKEIVVTDENYPSYTLPFGPLADRESGLPDTLTLTPFAPHLEEVDRYVKGEIMDDAEFEDVFDEDEYIAAQQTEGRVDHQTSGANHYAPELGRTFYFDPVDSEVHYTNVSRGKQRQPGTKPRISLGVYRLISEGKIPMIPAHNHYIDGLLSIDDWEVYWRSLQKNDDEGQDPLEIEQIQRWNEFLSSLPHGWRPVVRSSAILGPTTQTLVVATFDTLKRIHNGSFDTFSDEWKKRYANEDKDNLDRLQQHVIHAAQNGGWNTATNPVYARVKEELRRQERAAYDRVELAMAQDMGVGVYQATNYEDFDRKM